MLIHFFSAPANFDSSRGLRIWQTVACCYCQMARGDEEIHLSPIKISNIVRTKKCASDPLFRRCAAERKGKEKANREDMADMMLLAEPGYFGIWMERLLPLFLFLSRPLPLPLFSKSMDEFPPNFFSKRRPLTPHKFSHKWVHVSSSFSGELVSC